MPETKRSLKVFLSYASQDRTAVREIYDALKLKGWIDPWLDKAKILPGQDWQMVIETAVDEADVAILCFSNQSVSKEGFVQREIRYVYDIALEKPDGTIFLIPLRLEECEIPRKLRFLHRVDYFGVDKATAYADLVEALKLRYDQKLRTEDDHRSQQEREMTENKIAGSTAMLKEEKAQEIIKDQKLRNLFHLPKSIEVHIRIMFFFVIGFIILRFFLPGFVAAFPGKIPTLVVLTPTSIVQEATPSNTAPAPTHMISSLTPIIQEATPSNTVLALTPLVSSSTPTIQEATMTNTVPPPTLQSPTSRSSSTQISLIQSFPAPGLRAEGITWDGSFLWVTDNSATIFKLDSSGTVLDSFQSPEGTPQGITWDSSSFWVYTTNRSRIYQLQFSGGQTQVISYFVAPTQVIGGGITQDMAWDSGRLWYANQFNVYKLDTSCNTLSSFTYGKNVAGLDWDGSNLWLAYNDFPNNATLIKVSTTGETLESYPSPIFEVIGLAWANDYLWVLGLDSLGGNPVIYKLGISN